MAQEPHGTGPSQAAKQGRSRLHRLKTVADLVEVAGQMKASTVIVAGGDRIEDLRLVESARDHGIVDRIILVGKKRLIHGSVKELGIDIRPEDVVETGSDEETGAAVVRLIKEGGVDIVLKGNMSTPILNRHMLGTAVRSTVSLVTICDAAPIMGGKPFILTDAGFTTVCNFGRMVDLVNNAVEVAHLVMNIERPRVAILSANEKQIPSLPSTWIGAKLAERAWPEAVVYGPLSFDLATDPKSVAIKGIPETPGAREVAGKADVLICPGLDGANILYKVISALVKYGQASSAGITLGFSVPYIIISRADPLSIRLESIALCSIYSQQKAKGQELSVPARGSEREVMGRALDGVPAGAASAPPRGGSATPDETAVISEKAARSIGRPIEDINLVTAWFDPARGGTAAWPAVTVVISAVSRGETIDRGCVEASFPPSGGGPGKGTSLDDAVYRVAKEIGAMFAALECDVEAIVLGWRGSGAAKKEESSSNPGADLLAKGVRKRVGRLAPVLVFEEQADAR